MLLESLLDTPPAERRHRRWATLISFALQACGVATLIVLPLLYTQALPGLPDRVIALPTAPAGPPPGGEQRHTPRRGNVRTAPALLQQPHFVPRGIRIIHDQEPPTDASDNSVAHGPYVPGGIGPGTGNQALDQILRTNTDVAPPPPHEPVHVSQGVTAGWKIRDVQPAYPPMAMAVRIQGDVVLNAIIAADGSIEKLQVVSGHPLLIPAAVDAVRQWRYRPYYLNGQPVEVSTQITVRFVLGRN